MGLLKLAILLKLENWVKSYKGGGQRLATNVQNIVLMMEQNVSKVSLRDITLSIHDIDKPSIGNRVCVGTL